MDALTFILILDAILIAAASYNAKHNTPAASLYEAWSIFTLVLTLFIALATFSG